MPYYTNTNNDLYFLDSAEFEHFLPKDCIAITDEEAKEIEKKNNTPTEDEIIAQAIAKRNTLLVNSDWTQLPDVTVVGDWKTYRQLLRDITSQTGFPNDIDWPISPKD